MSQREIRHAFVSYVHEDGEAVDELCTILDAAGIPYWRDRNNLGPGDAWKAEIRRAIQEGSLAFLACFSNNSRARERSHMNEELTLAIEEYRLRPTGRPWLIPVRFDAGDLPYRDLGGGQLLSDLNYSDLFGKKFPAEAAKLVATIGRLIGVRQLNAATALAAVEQATDAARPALLRSMTKEMLLDPARRIELDDLVGQEVQRVTMSMNDEQKFPTLGFSADSSADRFAEIVHQAQQYWDLVEPFCYTLQVAARWADPEALQPWSSGLRTFVAATSKVQPGVPPLLDLRHLPGVAGIMTAALSCIAANRWASLKVLVVDPTVRDRYTQRFQSLLDSTDLHRIFPQARLAAHAMARAVTHGEEVEFAVSGLMEKRLRELRTPEADLLYAALRPVLGEQIADQDAYESEFDRAEVMLGALSEDSINQWRAVDTERSWGRTHWFGRSTWRAAHSNGDPVEDLINELRSQGATWPPLRGNLFAGDVERAERALASYKRVFDEVRLEQSRR